MATHSSTLAWKIPVTEGLCRLQSIGLQRVGHDWVTSLSFSLSGIGEGHGNPLQCSCLENARDGGAWWAALYGVTQSRTRLQRHSSSSSSGNKKVDVKETTTWAQVWLCFTVATLLGDRSEKMEKQKELVWLFIVAHLANVKGVCGPRSVCFYTLCLSLPALEKSPWMHFSGNSVLQVQAVLCAYRIHYTDVSDASSLI